MDKPDVDSIEGLSPAISIDQKTTSPQPAVDGRHGHGDLRLPAPAVGPHRQAPLLQLRPPDRRPVGRADHRPDHGPGGGDALHGPRPDRPRPQGRVRQAARGAALRGLHARQDRRRAAAAREEIVPRQEVQARHLDRGRPPDHAARSCASGSPTRSRPRWRWPTASSRSRRCRRQGPDRSPSASPCLHCGISMPELEPRIFSFNSPHGACPRCTGLGLADGDRPRLVVPGPSLSLSGGRDPAVVERGDELLRADLAGDRRALRDRPRHAVGGPDEDQQDLVPAGHQRRPHLRLVPQPDGAPALVHDELRGDHPQPRAPLPRDRLGLVARADRGVHVGAAVPGVQGRAAAAGVAGGARSPASRSTSSRRSAPARRSSGSRRSSCPTRTARSRG
jgi:hypothetical protein